MIPHRLNLLSPEKYQNLKRMVSFQFIKNLLETVLFIISVSGIILLGGQWILQDYFGKIAEQIISVSNRYADTNREIKKINTILNTLEKLQKEYQTPSVLLSEIIQKINPGIILSNLTINNEKITISGTAITRQDLLILKEQLDDLNFVEPSEIPPEQLIEKENINFFLVFKRR